MKDKNVKITKRVKKPISKKVLSKRKTTKPLARKKTLAIKVKTKRPIRRIVKSEAAPRRGKKPRFSFKKKVLALSVIACAALAVVFVPSIYNEIGLGDGGKAVLGSRTGVSPPNIPTNVKVVATSPASYKVTFETGLNMNDAKHIFVQMKNPYKVSKWQSINNTPYATNNIPSPLPTKGQCLSQLAMTKLEDGYYGYKPAHYQEKCIWQNDGAQDIYTYDVYSRKKIGFLNTKYQHTYIYIVNNLGLYNNHVFNDSKKVYFRVVAIGDKNKGVSYSDIVSVLSKPNYLNTATMKDITLPTKIRDFNPPFDKNLFYVQYREANPYNRDRGLVYQSSVNNSQESNGIFLCPTTNSSSKGYLINGSIQDIPFGKVGDIFLFRYFYKFHMLFPNGAAKYIPIATDPIIVKAGS